MSVIRLSVQHGTTLEQAKGRLQASVDEVRSRLPFIVRQVTWSDDRSRALVAGAGFRLELWVDPREVHITGDLTGAAGALANTVVAGLRAIVQRTFNKQLP